MRSTMMVEHIGNANRDHVCIVILLYIATVTLCLSCDFRMLLYNSSKFKSYATPNIPNK